MQTTSENHNESASKAFMKRRRFLLVVAVSFVFAQCSHFLPPVAKYAGRSVCGFFGSHVLWDQIVPDDTGARCLTRNTSGSFVSRAANCRNMMRRFGPQKQPECLLQESSLSFNFPSHAKHHFLFLFGGARGCYLDPLSTYLGAQAHRKFTQVRPQAGMKGISVDVRWNQHC